MSVSTGKRSALGPKADIPQSSARVRFAPKSSNRSHATPLAPATVRVAFIVFVDSGLPGDDLIPKPKPSVRADVHRSRKLACPLEPVQRGARDRDKIKNHSFGQHGPKSRLIMRAVFTVCHASPRQHLKQHEQHDRAQSWRLLQLLITFASFRKSVWCEKSLQRRRLFNLYT